MTDELVTHIRAALAEGADDVTRQRGMNACRTIMAALGTAAGRPMEASPPPTAPTPSPFVNAANLVASAPPGLLLDAVIAKLKAHLPGEDSSANPAPHPATLRIPFIPVPTLKGR